MTNHTPRVYKKGCIMISDHNISSAKTRGIQFKEAFTNQIKSMFTDVIWTPGPTDYQILYDEFSVIFEEAIYHAIIQMLKKSPNGSCVAINQTYYIAIKDGEISSLSVTGSLYDQNEIDLVFEPADDSEFYQYLIDYMANTKWPMDRKGVRYCYYTYVMCVLYTFKDNESFTLINDAYGTYTPKKVTHLHYRIDHFIGPELFKLWFEEIKGV